MDLKEKAILVNLSISAWSAKKYDKKVSKEVEKQHNTYDAGRYNKNLIATQELESMTKIAGEARNYHYTNTLCWSDNGDRLLPIDHYLEYTQKIGEYKNKFDNAVYNFIQVYPALIEDAKIKLNGMFNEADYPSPDQIEKKFRMKVETTALPNTDDFRVNINDEELDKIKSEIVSNVQSRTDNAVKDVMLRIKDKVEKMHERLSDSDKSFKDSLVGNVRDLVLLLPKLNVTDNPVINDLMEDIKKLTSASAHNLRNDTRLRQEKAETAKAIFNKVSDYI
jgi:hypothetical protein